MKRSRHMALGAFTRRELLVLLAIVAIMAAVFVAAMQGAQRKAKRIRCVNNLGQLGLGFRTWAIEGGAGFSGQASTNGAASPGAITHAEAFRYFQVRSNALASPKLLVCPADVRVPAMNFGPGFSNTNLSYFVSLDADEAYPQMFLCGDRNLTNGLPIQDGILLLTPDRPVWWTHEIHNRQGNVALADGSVQGISNRRLSAIVPEAGTTNRLAMP